MKLFMCGVDFQHELGECNTEVFDSVARLKQHKPCWESCGIVEFDTDIYNVKWIAEQNLMKNSVCMDDIPKPLRWLQRRVQRFRMVWFSRLNKTFKAFDNYVYSFGRKDES